ncbi:MAG: hypothetical protein IJ677_05775 [Alphaproteobacteria bacterium]|nr:hypothetical protein [Alphaproteobacteria bacterium]
MIARVVIGILLGYVLIAYWPLIWQCMPYLWPVILLVVAFFALRTLPVLAEPLGYGLLAALLCYIIYLLLKHKGKLKDMIKNVKNSKKQLPVINIKRHPQISILLTLTLYTLGVTLAIYILILLIYVQ